MDLSFTRRLLSDHALRRVSLAHMLGAALERQAASPTAVAAAAIKRRVDALLSPGSGAFHAATAAALIRWKLL